MPQLPAVGCRKLPVGTFKAFSQRRFVDVGHFRLLSLTYNVPSLFIRTATRPGLYLCGRLVYADTKAQRRRIPLPR